MAAGSAGGLAKMFPHVSSARPPLAGAAPCELAAARCAEVLCPLCAALSCGARARARAHACRTALGLGLGVSGSFSLGVESVEMRIR